MDMAVFVFGKHRVQVPYQTAFEILNGVRLASKMAMRVEGNEATAWRDFARINGASRDLTPARRFRRSNLQSNVKTWAVQFDGPLVVMVFDELTVKIHYSEALPWYTAARLAAREAQAWAGDSKKVMRCVGHLTDAEENYKHGHA